MQAVLVKKCSRALQTRRQRLLCFDFVRSGPLTDSATRVPCPQSSVILSLDLLVPRAPRVTPLASACLAAPFGALRTVYLVDAVSFFTS